MQKTIINTVIALAICIFIIINIEGSVEMTIPFHVYNHNLEFDFDLINHSIAASDKITLNSSERYFRFLLNRDFTVSRVTVQDKKRKCKRIDDYDWSLFGDNFESEDSLFFQRCAMYRVKLKKKELKLDSLYITVQYQGTLYDTVSVAAFSRAQIADQTMGIIGEEGIYLSPEACYYPYIDEQPAVFQVTTYTPQDYLTVTDGRLAATKTANGFRLTQWEGEQPADGIYISGGKWELVQDEYNGVQIYSFFFPEDRELGEQYAGAVARYLQLYDGLIGEYSYSKFAVVENFFSTGYGMPSWTLLGREVVKLPWIIHTSLGHEICHNWWGNGVFVDYKNGNWCEGLTTYCADYLYKERKSSDDARQYRRTINQDYTAYVNQANDYPLTEFRERTETYTRAIGYGKSTMVFHMLKILLGEEIFWKSLQDFYREFLYEKASWDDIQNVFENNYGEDLEWFFKQWVHQKGAPYLSISQVSLENFPSGYRISLKIQQEEPLFNLKIPLTVYYDGAEATQWFSVSSAEELISIECADKPLAVCVDSDFHLFRRLDRREYPASLSEVLGAEKQMIVLPTLGEADKIQAYREMAENLTRSGDAIIISDDEISGSLLGVISYFVLGMPDENQMFELLADNGVEWSNWIVFTGEGQNFRIMNQTFQSEDASFLITLRNPLNIRQSIAVFSATSAEEIEQTGRKIFHYGKYSYLAFEGGKNKLKGNWDVILSPLRYDFGK